MSNKTVITAHVYLQQIADDQLEPCPFCGSDDLSFSAKRNSYGERFYSAQVYCRKCGGKGGRSKYLETMLEKWNRRTDD